MRTSKKIYAFAAIMMFILLVPIVKVSASEVTRLSGQDRYETSANISKNNWSTSENVVLSSGQGDDKFADSLAGTTLAYQLNSPILLTNTNYIPTVISDEIKRLNAENIYLLGGTGVISSAVENSLKNLGYSVTRLSGLNRYETAARIGEEVKKYKPIGGVFLTTGYKFQYAMAALPYVGKENDIVLFTDGNSLNFTTKDVLKRLNVDNVTILGGNAVVPSNVDNELMKMGITVKRIDGNTPIDFNTNILRTLGNNIDGLAVASGRVFADSLSGSIVAAKNNLGMALIDDKFDYNMSMNKLNKILIYGGYSVVTPETESYLKGIMANSNLSDKTGRLILNGKKDWYEAIKTAISNCQDEFLYDNANSSAMPKGIVEMVLEQNPDIDYVESYSISNSGSISFNYRFSKTELSDMKNRAAEKAKSVLSNIIKPDMTETEKAKAIHDYIVSNAKYDYDSYAKNSIPAQDYTAYGILVNGTGVCQGYASAFNLMAEMSGIKSIAVRGTAGGGVHVWNMAMLDGKIGYIDTTWDDPVPDRAGQIIYRYFNISGSQISEDHSWDKNNFTEDYLNY
ncbi:cell wall-binding repeat-containing protein [Clostridium sp. MT-14]|uniref:cell wall-binding repeat-containing protein n=1 Tax=Clostridium sp. MT-14 TaxID=3348360 RepID=UPI0035F361EB